MQHGTFKLTTFSRWAKIPELRGYSITVSPDGARDLLDETGKSVEEGEFRRGVLLRWNDYRAFRASLQGK